MNDTETKTAFKKKHVLVDVIVEAELSGMLLIPRNAPQEQRAKELERAVKEFHDFLRDHRSQDMVILEVKRKYADLCSACGSDEFDVEFGDETTPTRVICAWCGAIIEDKSNE